MTKVNEGKKCTYTVNEAGVALMEISNPPMNALSRPVLADIRDTLAKALTDKAVRVIVFTGAGKAFIAGADISELNDFETAQEGADFLIPGQEISHLFMHADKPVIAAINGFCLGGGMEMALACHIRLADEAATLGLPEIKLGIIPGYGGTQRTPRLIGAGRALELILSGNFLNGKQAEEYGLVNRAVAKGTVVDEAMKLAGAIAAKSRVAVQAALRAVHEGGAMDLHSAMKYEREQFGICYASEDKKEGVAAFSQKREPKFRDR
ncbi:MAG TPA: enoyl-CoA hydratase-related protein [Deltaproteobacteria bacterium]|mgnify:CR=1 FL=1|nr:enoyl-CoA hydratase-related protein [Deltaproteobacteria bacterium]HPR54669.1 enoyl-CoA hydratase-related protein [Deltaproteobacteria bacterium]HXK46666.1 enoyl-CoA hydratase-related protein [Deltaproteobacteria bacterium]